MLESQEQEESLTSSSTLPEFADLDREYAEILAIPDSDQQEEKPKRGRRKKADVEEVPELDITPDMIESWVSLPLDSWFVRNGKKPLTNLERKAWSQSCSRLLNKWLPNVTSKWQEEIGAAVCLVTIFSIRMEAPEVKLPEETKEEVKEEKKEEIS